jgi:hypothetical protein
MMQGYAHDVKGEEKRQREREVCMLWWMVERDLLSKNSMISYLFDPGDRTSSSVKSREPGNPSCDNSFKKESNSIARKCVWEAKETSRNE